jgi:hypothetical protein
MKEKNFEKQVKEYLKSIDAYYIKYWGGGAYTKSGVPDILACIDGKFYGIELKADTGKPSELQLWNLNHIEKAGGYALLLYPDDFEDFKKFVSDPKNNWKIYVNLYGRNRLRWENYYGLNNDGTD